MTGPGEAGPKVRKRGPQGPAIDAEAEAVIAAYLTAHPDFVQRHPAVLQALIPPAVDRGRGVVDFQRYMVARLQNDVQSIGVEKSALIHTARANAQSQSRFHEAALALIEARSLGQMVEILTGDLAVTLDVDVVALIVEAEEAASTLAQTPGVRLVEPGTASRLLGRRDVALHGDITGEPALYGPAAALVRSEGLLRLPIGKGAPVCLVAFGSRDPHLFRDGQGTELIVFLGGVLQRLLAAWLGLPA